MIHVIVTYHFETQAPVNSIQNHLVYVNAACIVEFMLHPNLAALFSITDNLAHDVWGTPLFSYLTQHVTPLLTCFHISFKALLVYLFILIIILVARDSFPLLMFTAAKGKIFYSVL